MSTWEELRGVCVEKMAEYESQAAAANTETAYDDDTILKRMLEKYVHLFAVAKEKNVRRFVEKQSFVYPSDTEYVDLATVPSPSLEYADVQGLYDITGQYAENPAPLSEMSEAEYDHYLVGGSAGNGQSWHWFIDGNDLHLIPRPKAATTLRCRYVVEPTVTGITTGAGNWGDADQTPDKFPSRYHPLIAIEAALSFLRVSGDGPQGLQDERNELLDSFIKWASGGRRQGRRYVREIV